MSEPIPDNPQGAERILTAAQQLFAQKGFAATSMQEVAQQAGVSKSNVFHHFKSKEDLYVAVIGCACGEAHDRVLALLGGDGTFAQRLKRMMRADLEFMFENPERAHLVLREIASTQPNDPTQPAPALLRRNAVEMVETIRAAQQAGEIRADIDPAAVALLLFATNKFYFQTRNLIRHFPEVGFAADPADFVETMADLILNGVLPR